MLSVTKSAWNRLSKLQSSRPDVSAMRLLHDNGTVKCRKGIRRPDDRIIERDGHPNILLTPDVSRELQSLTLHAPKTERGRRLRLREKTNQAAQTVSKEKS